MGEEAPIQHISVRVEYLAHLDRYAILCDSPVYPFIQDAIRLGIQQLLTPPVLVTFEEERYPQRPRLHSDEEARHAEP